ncbi:MAG: tRNA (adenosine(37)-N6)-dimethylallyltransferase MiaA [Clostridia bacterium]|nr:tRNA (adenosine(37)-N6)-dimethylallyltransferase MiaA [Clostridia bacterium]
MTKPVVYVVTGPTASGKSDLAMEIAQKMQGEIICMDSMQIYRGMDIGTAKPTREEQRRIPHHMVDVVDPKDCFTVAEYKDAAESCIRDILSRGKQPLFVGGTGLYLRALRTPMAMGGAQGSEAFRKELEELSRDETGRQTLHQRLQTVDPESAGKIHPNNVRRVIRALEVYEATGIPFSRQENPQEESPFAYRVVTLDLPRDVLYERVDRRVLKMVRMGLEDEIRSLLSRGVPRTSQAMQAIGYKEWFPYLDGEGTLDETISLIQLNSRRYAKRQLTWMRREENLLWLDAGDGQLMEKTLKYFLE